MLQFNLQENYTKEQTFTELYMEALFVLQTTSTLIKQHSANVSEYAALSTQIL